MDPYATRIVVAAIDADRHRTAAAGRLARLARIAQECCRVTLLVRVASALRGVPACCPGGAT